MASRGISVDVHGVDKVNRFLREQIAGEDLVTARGVLRQRTKAIAQDIVIPALRDGAAASGVPSAPAVAATARARTDRVVTVRIGAVNPKLSGFKAKPKRPGARRPIHSAQMRTTVAFGAVFGPHPSNPDNPYAVTRNPDGYWVLPTLRAPALWNRVREEYLRIFDDLLRDYGRTR